VATLKSKTGPLVVAGLALALYLLTLAPTVLWGDDAELQRIVVTGEARTIGQSSAASHLLWLALARPFVRATGLLPLDAAGRTSLLSALTGALALVFVYLAGKELGGPLGRRAGLAGLLAAGALGVSHTFWLLAVRPAVYTLSMLLVALATWATLCWRRTFRPAWLAAGAVAMALALTNHVLTAASAPGLVALAVAVPRPQRRRLLLAVAVALGLGAVALGAAAALGAPLVDLLAAATAFRPAPPSLRELAAAPAFLVYQFPLTLPLAAWGAVRLWREDRGALVGVLLLYAGNVLLILLHHPPAGISFRDQFLFYLPSYLPLALLVGVGGAAAVGDVPGAARWLPVAVAAAVLAPLAIYPLAAGVAGAVATRLVPARSLPGRDPVAFYLLPGKGGYSGARDYGEAALERLAPQAAVVADWLPYQTLLYLQRVEGRRPDVLLSNINAGTGEQLRFLLQHSGQRPLYLADAASRPYYDVEEIERCFSLSPEGPLFRLQPRGAAGCG
jgi:hypothetical protein